MTALAHVDERVSFAEIAKERGLSECRRRELPGDAAVEFELIRAGCAMSDGSLRQVDYRAYWYTPQPACELCGGAGRVPSLKRPGGTVKCQPCKGTGERKRDRMVSVTTLLDAILPKPGLPRWAEARGIEGVIAALGLGEITVTTDPADAIRIVRTLKLGADRARDIAADRGLDVHGLLEQYMRTGDAPRRPENPAHHGYFEGLCSWLLKVDPEPEAIEDLVCDPKAGYAGRRDLVARAGGFRVGYDAKTQERAGIYTGAHLQLKMYERAAVASGDDPCDLLTVVVFAENGEWREMPCEATDRTVDRALAFYEDIKPIDSLCEQRNRRERESRAQSSVIDLGQVLR